MAVLLWRRVALWLDLDLPVFSSTLDMVELIDARPTVRMKRVIIDYVFMVVIWLLWTYWNAILFHQSKSLKHLFFDSIVETSFCWFSFSKGGRSCSRLEGERDEWEESKR